MHKPHEPPADPMPTTGQGPVPGFTLGGLIGEGGMGLVYRATQHKPRRAVALKLLRPTAVSPRALRRFEREAEILARLQHPGIARVYEAGITQNVPGSNSATDPLHHQPAPYFVMELIEGVGLKRYAEQSGLTTRDRLALFAEVCDAVHYAHEQGVIHRDLKPANILVDPAGHPKVLDFGIARVTGSEQTLATMQTDIGQMLGTLPYMSPEQAAGDPEAADARSDVYALGITLYELLAGRLPYHINTASLPEAARVIRDEEPAPMSISNRALRGDVETIVGRCLEKEPQRRYASAAALAEDIRRYLTSRPILARPPSGWYQAGRFAKRNKALVGGLAAVFVSLVLGMVGTSLGRSQAPEARQREATQRAEAEKQRREAQLAAQRAEASEEAMARALAEQTRMRELAEKQSRLATNTSSLYLGMLRSIDPVVARGRDTSLLVRVLENGDRMATQSLSGHPEDESRLRYEIGQSYNRLGMYDRAYDQFHLAHQLAMKSIGPAARHTQSCRLMLANMSMYQGDFNTSVRLNREAVAFARRLKGIETGSFVIATHNLGNSYLKLDMLEESVELTETIHTLLPYVDDAPAGFDQDIEVARAVHMMQEGQMQQALDILDRVFRDQIKELGIQHPTTLSTAFNLAWALIETDRLQNAIKLLKDIMPTVESIHQDEPLIIYKMQMTLASAYYRSGRTDLSIPKQRDLLDFCERALGSEHPDTLAMVHHLAKSHQLAGNLNEARSLYTRAVTGNETVLGPNHPHTLNDIHALGNVLSSQGEFDQAEALIKTYIERASKQWGADFISVFRARRSLVRNALRAGDPARARQLVESMYTEAERVFGLSHPHTAEFAPIFAEVLIGDGDMDRAERILLRAMSALPDEKSIFSSDRAETASQLARLYDQQGRPNLARRYRAEADALRDAVPITD